MQLPIPAAAANTDHQVSISSSSKYGSCINRSTVAVRSPLLPPLKLVFPFCWCSTSTDVITGIYSFIWRICRDAPTSFPLFPTGLSASSKRGFKELGWLERLFRSRVESDITEWQGEFVDRDQRWLLLASDSAACLAVILFVSSHALSFPGRNGSFTPSPVLCTYSTANKLSQKSPIYTHAEKRACVRRW